jgi:hypothetical protein
MDFEAIRRKVDLEGRDRLAREAAAKVKLKPLIDYLQKNLAKGYSLKDHSGVLYSISHQSSNNDVTSFGYLSVIEENDDARYYRDGSHPRLYEAMAEDLIRYLHQCGAPCDRFQLT